MDMEAEEYVGSMADLLQQLGDVPLHRIRVRPAPGTATEQDVLDALEGPQKRICELVDGVLIEKPMGHHEAMLASLLGHFLWEYLKGNDIGVVMGADGPVKLEPRQVRFPDLCFVSWEKFPEGKFPQKDRILQVAPDLAIEVLSESNTRAEMDRKLRDYFFAGVQMVWLINPKTQTAEVYTSPTDKKRIPKNGSLDGGEVLPGFRVALPKLFAKTRRRTA